MLYDAQVNGRMDDDRSKTGKVRQLLDEAATGLREFEEAHDAWFAQTATGTTTSGRNKA